MSKYEWEDLKKTVRNYSAFGACCINAFLFGVGSLICGILALIQLSEKAYLTVVALLVGGALCAFVAYLSGVIAFWIYDNLEGFV